jgi:hypothetical protein
MMVSVPDNGNLSLYVFSNVLGIVPYKRIDRFRDGYLLNVEPQNFGCHLKTERLQPSL